MGENHNKRNFSSDMRINFLIMKTPRRLQGLLGDQWGFVCGKDQVMLNLPSLRGLGKSIPMVGGSRSFVGYLLQVTVGLLGRGHVGLVLSLFSYPPGNFRPQQPSGVYKLLLLQIRKPKEEGGYPWAEQKGRYFGQTGLATLIFQIWL